MISGVQTGLEPIIIACCNVKATEFEAFQQAIIHNFDTCDLSDCSITEQQMERLKESRGRKLIMTRPRFREYFRHEVYRMLLLNKMVRPRGYDLQDVTYGPDTSYKQIEKLLETCLVIFVNKQKSLIK